MEGRKRRTAVFLLLLVCCWLLVLNGGVLAQTWQKVVPCASASGGGTPTYLGVTSSSYTGAAIGGYTGANAKCVAQYGAGARFMTITDKRKINRSTDYPSNGWIDIKQNYIYGSNGGFYIIVDDYGNSGNTSLTLITCESFSGNTHQAFFLSTTGTLATQNCTVPTPIHCVKD